METMLRGTVGSTGFFACMGLQSVNTAVSLIVGVMTFVFLGLSIYKLLKEVPMSVSSVAQEQVDSGLSGVGASDLIKSLLAEKEKAEPKAKVPANDLESPF